MTTRQSELSFSAGVLAVLLGLGLGLGVLQLVQNARHRGDVAASMQGLAVPSAIDAADVVTNESPPTATPAPEVVEEELPANDEGGVHLDVPEGAQLFVGGEEIPGTTRSFPRPDAGELRVVVRAPGSEDAVVAVRSDSPAVIKVVLPKKRPAKAPPPLEMPPNPYD